MKNETTRRPSETLAPQSRGAAQTKDTTEEVAENTTQQLTEVVDCTTELPVLPQAPSPAPEHAQEETRSVAVGQSTQDANAESTPFLAKVHPMNADIPKLPARYSPTSDYYWHFGFPVSIAEVRAILEKWAPSRVRISPRDDSELMQDLLVMANRIWPLTKLFYVQPEEGSADNVQTIHETLDNRRAVSFYSLMSTEKEHFISRPGPKELEALTTFFGKQPVWREDAIEKSIWADYYDEHYDSDDYE